MNRNMVVVVTLGIFGILSATNGGALGEIQCTCPSIAADGKGNSSCSATEASSRCSVDFNEFGPGIEQVAADFAGSVGGKRVDFQHLPSFEIDTAGQLHPAVLTDQLITYLAVSIVGHPSFQRQEWGAEGFGDVVNTISDNVRSVRDAFFGERPFQDNGIFVSNGCIEAEYGDAWSMYKAFWSDAGAAPQCK